VRKLEEKCVLELFTRTFFSGTPSNISTSQRRVLKQILKKQKEGFSNILQKETERRVLKQILENEL